MSCSATYMDSKFFNFAFLFLLTLNVVLIVANKMPFMAWLGLSLLSIGFWIISPTHYHKYNALITLTIFMGAVFQAYTLFVGR